MCETVVKVFICCFIKFEIYAGNDIYILRIYMIQEGYVFFLFFHSAFRGDDNWQKSFMPFYLLLFIEVLELHVFHVTFLLFPFFWNGLFIYFLNKYWENKGKWQKENTFILHKKIGFVGKFGNIYYVIKYLHLKKIEINLINPDVPPPRMSLICIFFENLCSVS